jgi:hypothetical protein
MSTTYHVQAQYERGGQWLSIAWFDRRAGADLTATTSAMPRDGTGAEAHRIRVISASDLGRERTIGRAAAVMLSRH